MTDKWTNLERPNTCKIKNKNKHGGMDFSM